MATNIFVWIGYSQSRGAAANSGLEAQYQGTFTNVKLFNGSTFASLQQNVNNNYPTQDTNGGAIYSFGKAMQANSGGTDYHIMYAIGGTSLVVDWEPTTRGSYYDAMVSTVNKALANLWANGIRSDVTITFNISLGIVEALDIALYSQYQAKLMAFIAALRASFSGTAFASLRKSVIMNKIGTDQSNAGTPYPYITEINDAMDYAAANNTYVYAVTGTGWANQVDDHHLTCDGYKSMGLDESAVLISNGV